MDSPPRREHPASAEDAARILAEGRRIRIVGGATKLDWGNPGVPSEVELFTDAMDRLVEHNAGDLTAVAQAGARLGDVQAAFAERGQRLALDPPNPEGRATVGGVFAAGDSGPLRHRFGAPRDLVLGVQVALADGTVARAGSRVIKNVAGYDLAKLMCGALGTLGVVCELTVRLHPLATQTVTAVGEAPDAASLARAARLLGGRPLELESLDVRWNGKAHGGDLVARAAGHTAHEAARTAAQVMDEQGLQSSLTEDDEHIWQEQRRRQRAPAGRAVVRVSGLAGELEQILQAVPEAVARPGLGLVWVPIDPEPAALSELRAALSPAHCVLLEAPERLRDKVDPWGLAPGPELSLLRRVKERFDPRAVCNAGCYVGGL